MVGQRCPGGGYYTEAPKHRAVSRNETFQEDRRLAVTNNNVHTARLQFHITRLYKNAYAIFNNLINQQMSNGLILVKWFNHILQ